MRIRSLPRKSAFSFVGVLLRSLLLPNLDSNSEKEGSSLDVISTGEWLSINKVGERECPGRVRVRVHSSKAPRNDLTVRYIVQGRDLFPLFFFFFLSFLTFPVSPLPSPPFITCSYVESRSLVPLGCHHQRQEGTSRSLSFLLSSTRKTLACFLASLIFTRFYLFF